MTSFSLRDPLSMVLAKVTFWRSGLLASPIGVLLKPSLIDNTADRSSFGDAAHGPAYDSACFAWPGSKLGAGDARYVQL